MVCGGRAGGHDVPRRIGFSISEENFPGADLTADEWEFLQAIEAYKRKFRRRFPSWREAFAVLHTLGYRKPPTDSLPVAVPPISEQS